MTTTTATTTTTFTTTTTTIITTFCRWNREQQTDGGKDKKIHTHNKSEIYKRRIRILYKHNNREMVERDISIYTYVCVCVCVCMLCMCADTDFSEF